MATPDEADVGLVVLGIATNQPSHLGASLSSGTTHDFTSIVKVIQSLGPQHRYVIANNVSPRGWESAEPLWRDECRLALGRYGLGDDTSRPGTTCSRIHEAPPRLPSTEPVLIVSITVLAAGDLSALGECGLDAQELRVLASDLGSYIPPESVVGFDVAVSRGVLFDPDIRHRYPELVALD